MPKKNNIPPIKIYVYDRMNVDIDTQSIDTAIDNLLYNRDKILSIDHVDPESLTLYINGTGSGEEGDYGNVDIDTHIEFRRLETDKEYKCRLKIMELLKPKPKKKVKKK